MHASPVFWGKKAAELRHAANLLWPECERQMDALLRTVQGESDGSDFPKVLTFHVYSSLLGHSLECLFKGKIIMDDLTVISNGRMARKLHTHNLRKLASMAKIQLTRHEEIFCDTAQRVMDTEFRYPVPKSHDIQAPAREIGGKWPDVFEGLFSRIYPTLNLLIQARDRAVRVPWL
jgi:hypothetical protein